MILRRVIDHVRKQEWTAIVIDFVIVVLGVFVGIQVSNWNEARKDRARADDYIARLANDVELEVALWGHAIDYYSTARDYGRVALAGFKADPATLDEDFLIAVYQASQVWYAAPNRATFDELQSTGGIVVLRDPALRTSLSNHYLRVGQTLFTLQQTSQYRRIARLYIDETIQDAIRASCGDKWTTNSRNAYYVDFPKSCAIDIPQPLAREEIAALHANQEVRRELRFQMSVLAAQIGVMKNARETGVATLRKLREAA